MAHTGTHTHTLTHAARHPAPGTRHPAPGTCTTFAVASGLRRAVQKPTRPGKQQRPPCCWHPQPRQPGLHQAHAPTPYPGSWSAWAQTTPFWQAPRRGAAGFAASYRRLRARPWAWRKFPVSTAPTHHRNGLALVRAGLRSGSVGCSHRSRPPNPRKGRSDAILAAG